MNSQSSDEAIQEASVSKYHLQEALRAGTLGTYRVNALFTRISSDGDLEPEVGEPLPGAVALHAHEYTHYLHNLSTIAGVMSLLSSFWLLLPFIKNADSNARIQASSATGVDDDVASAFQVMNAMRGITRGIPNNHSWSNVLSWKFEPPTSVARQIIHSSETLAQITVFSFKATAMFSSGHSLELEIQPGLDFITEGVAYEIERETRRLAGIPEEILDDQTPSYPYLIFRPLVDFLTGHQSSAEDRIVIGTLALLSHSPSEGLIRVCEVIRTEAEEGSNEGFGDYTNQLLNHFKNYSDHVIESQLATIASILSGSEVLSTGASVYCQLIRTALVKRQEYPVMEAAFIKSKMDAGGFLQRSLRMLERQVCQEKNWSANVISWIGLPGSVADQPDETLQAFSILQSAIHYVQQHFTTDSIVPTAQLRDTPCPFSGACETQVEKNFPTVCDTRPWEFQYSTDRANVCFYEAAQIALIKQPIAPST